MTWENILAEAFFRALVPWALCLTAPFLLIWRLMA